MTYVPLSRRDLLRASVAGLAAATPAVPSVAAASTAAGQQMLHYRESTGGSVTASPDGSVLIAEVQGVLWRVPPGGGAAVRITDWELEATRPVLSPDRRRLAVGGYRGGGFHLWTLRTDGSGLRRITDGPWDDRGVAWSPDGTRLVFSSERGGDAVTGAPFGLWTVDADGGHPVRLTGGNHEDFDPVWWPDGRSVVCVRAAHTAEGGSDGGLTLVRVPVAGGREQVIRTEREGRLLCPSVSPSGRIAHLHLSGTTASPSLPAAQVALMVDGRVVTEDEDPAAAPPCWLGDDRLLYVADGRIRVRTLDAPGAARDVPFTARMPVPRPRRRTRPPLAEAAEPVRGIHGPALSPDGNSVAFVALNALWLMPVDGMPRKSVQASAVHHVQMPAWAPDGRSVLYCTDRDGLTAVRRVHLDSGHDEPVTGPGRLNPALSPDGSRLACQDVNGNLLVRDLPGGDERVLARPLATDGPPGAPTWSPDGRYVAFCDRNRLNRRFREGYHLIRVLDTRTGTEKRHLPAAHQSLSDRAAAGPAWSPDGRWMALVAESTLWLLPVAGDGTPTGPARRLADEPADHPTWAREKNTLLYLSSGRLRLLDPAAALSGPRTLSVPISRRPARNQERLRVHAGQLWDATGTAPRDDVDILIDGGRIAAVEPHRPRRPGHRTVDASQHTVLPGLFDAHTHPYSATYGARHSLTALAYGITTTACLGAPLYEAVRLRESLASGHSLGPRLLACAELIDGARTAYSMGRAHRTTAGVRRTLERATALKVDFVKTYVRASGEVMAQAADAARMLGVPSGSHLCSPGRAAGQDLTTHLQATQRLPYGHATTPKGHIHDDLVQQYADGGFAMIMTPFTAQFLLGDDPALADDPRVLTLMPPWDTAAVRERAHRPPTGHERQALATEMADYRNLATHGALLALGTDAPLVPAGLSLHLALRALHAHGFSPARALLCATAAPARLFRVENDLGTVQPGKIADLTVVDGDPFTDFSRLVRTPLVLRAGTAHQQTDLVHALETAHLVQTGGSSRASRRRALRVPR
ncbi:PD40 domain-containing protein [Streptomyces sp. 5-8]|uniref:PD40 domain-containing protein n=1 Tax=Streptomyces musisoli TaxID=2802280 RepID=A0ABS1NWE7_9ACTN|nr:amidohydrolase family protein [Streptomyces musisoli]MBL1104447.1 PD40 domain-containing protein [Streptomyces musisoli]